MGPLNNNHKSGTDGGEYTGPVFIIRELDREKSEYDAFITTGGIQEVRGSDNGNGAGVYGGGPKQQQHVVKPTATDDEDTKYFGVLVTPDTVKQLNISKTSAINVQLTVILAAASSRMPWLLVLHRKNYPHLFESPEVPIHQQQQQYAPQVPSQGGIPNMQVPQRRRFTSERQRREVVFNDGRSNAAVVPLALEDQLMTTMCYNFLHDTMPSSATASVDYDYDYNDARGNRDIVFNPNTYVRKAVKLNQMQPPATTASSTVQSQSQSQPQPEPQPSDVDEQSVNMAIPKRIS